MKILKKMKKTHTLLLKFIIFNAIIGIFTIVCIFFTEKTDVLGLQDLPVETVFTDEGNGKIILSWKRLPYPCFYRVETFTMNTGLVEGSPKYHSVQSDYTVNSSYEVPTAAVPTYYQISAYGIFGKVATSKEYVPNPNYIYPMRPVPVLHYTKDNPASVKPYLVWHSIPDAVVYELEILSDLPDKENTVSLSTKNHIYSTQMVFTNGMQFDLEPYLKNIPKRNGYKRIFWRVRAMNLRKLAVGVFSTTEEVVVDVDAPIPNKPMLNNFDQMPNFKMPLYPVYHWLPMLGVDKYEVELMTHPPEEENNTEPTPDRYWAKTVDSSFACYDEYARPYAGEYYWRVRGVDKDGNTVGVYSDTSKFVMDSSIQRCLAATFGDSITHGGGAVSFSPASLEYSYQTYLDFPVVNLGRSGDTSHTTMERFESDVLPIHPVNLLIMTGSNSLRSASTSAEDMITDLQAIGQKCEQNGIRPIFITLLPLNPNNILYAFRTPTDPKWKEKMTAVNEFIRRQQYYIDIEGYFYDTGQFIMDPKWANDGLHPDVQGKILMAEVINKHQHLLLK